MIEREKDEALWHVVDARYTKYILADFAQLFGIAIARDQIFIVRQLMLIDQLGDQPVDQFGDYRVDQFVFGDFLMYGGQFIKSNRR